MKFFDRTREIKRLQEIYQISQESAQFTIITGRRRIGKTELVKKAYTDMPMLYFFVARKAEADLCRSFMGEISEKLLIPIPDGNVKEFAAVFKYIMQLAQQQHITLFIDEFQDFYKVNPSIFSDMQNIWDTYKGTAKINLIVAGSVDSLMHRIFRDEKEPLFGRQTSLMHVQPFTPSVVKDILRYYHPDYDNADLLALYTLTGGVAKYIEVFIDNKKYTQKSMLDMVFSPDSYFLTEGKNLLVEEFGKDYNTYFSILTLISTGINTRADIESSLGEKSLSGYIHNLIEDYSLVEKRQPLLEKSVNKNVRYGIKDLFLRFWFRFIYKYAHILEAGGYERLRQIAERDFSTFSGVALEAYFREKIKETGLCTRQGYWHDRKGHNEIDIIAEDELERHLDIIEVKRNERNIDLSILRAKAEVFFTTTGAYSDYDITYKGLSMKDM